MLRALRRRKGEDRHPKKVSKRELLSLLEDQKRRSDQLERSLEELSKQKKAVETSAASSLPGLMPTPLYTVQPGESSLIFAGDNMLPATTLPVANPPPLPADVAPRAAAPILAVRSKRTSAPAWIRARSALRSAASSGRRRMSSADTKSTKSPKTVSSREAEGSVSASEAEIYDVIYDVIPTAAEPRWLVEAADVVEEPAWLREAAEQQVREVRDLNNTSWSRFPSREDLLLMHTEREDLLSATAANEQLADSCGAKVTAAPSSTPKTPHTSEGDSSLDSSPSSAATSSIYGSQYRDLAVEMAWAELGGAHETSALRSSAFGMANRWPPSSGVLFRI